MLAWEMIMYIVMVMRKMIIMIIINNIHYPRPILNIVMIRVMKILIGGMMKIMKMVMILSFLHKKNHETAI